MFRHRDTSSLSASTIEELRVAAYRHWPRSVRDYVEGGVDAERSLFLNRQAFSRFMFHPRVLRDVNDLSLAANFLGGDTALPFGLGPTGYTKIIHGDGECGAAEAAARAGIPYVISTMATTPMEEIAQTGGNLWFQLYATRDRDSTDERLARAQSVGCRVLVVTVDAPVTGNRVRDLRNRFVLPPRVESFVRPRSGTSLRWLLQYWKSQPVRFANFPTGASQRVDTASFAAMNFDPGLSWSDFASLRDMWAGPIVLKGVTNVADAEMAMRLGIDGLILSNHGGRQLDGTIPPVLLVNDVRRAVGTEFPVYVDSGIRQGSDIAIALGLGASGCLIGRAYLYGLGAGGQHGCERAIQILADELARTMRLLGVRSVAELRSQGPDLVRTLNDLSLNPPLSSEVRQSDG